MEPMEVVSRLIGGNYLDFIIEAVKRHPQKKGFEPPPKRGMRERTFG